MWGSPSPSSPLCSGGWGDRGRWIPSIRSRCWFRLMGTSGCYCGYCVWFLGRPVLVLSLTSLRLFSMESNLHEVPGASSVVDWWGWGLREWTGWVWRGGCGWWSTWVSWCPSREVFWPDFQGPGGLVLGLCWLRECSVVVRHPG
jgi:hypothetical protein